MGTTVCKPATATLAIYSVLKRRRVRERYYNAAVQQHDVYSGDGPILRLFVVTFARRIFWNIEFQGDTARPHRARVAVYFLK